MGVEFKVHNRGIRSQQDGPETVLILPVRTQIEFAGNTIQRGAGAQRRLAAAGRGALVGIQIPPTHLLDVALARQRTRTRIRGGAYARVRARAGVYAGVRAHARARKLTCRGLSSP